MFERLWPRHPWGRARALLAALPLAVLLWAGVTAHGGDARLFPGGPGVPRTRIYLIDNGFHTDLALPRASLADAPAPLGAAVSAATRQPWIVLGWGDENFYTATGVSVARGVDGLRALFVPGNPSVIRIEGLAGRPDQMFEAGAVRPILITDAGLRRLEARAGGSLMRDPRGRPVRGPASAEADTAYFRSVEHFSLFHLCNHWTSDLLNAAGLPTTPVIDTVPAGLRLDLTWRAGV